MFTLLFMAAAFSIYASRREHLRAPWREVGRSGVAMSSLVVLFFYLTVGLLDSIHYRPKLDGGDANNSRYSTEVVSVFDRMLGSLRDKGEKTYSAPFATHLYSRELIVSTNGEQQYIYSRLEHGGAHLKAQADKTLDIVTISLWALFKAFGIWLLLISIAIWLISLRSPFTWRQILQQVAGGTTIIRWRAVLLTLLVIIAAAWIIFDLAQKYHVLGTDKVGTSVLYQSLKSIRTGLVIGTLTTLVMLPFAVILGTMAGYFGGWIDDIIQYIYTTLSSIPAVLLIAAAILILQVYLDNHAAEIASAAERADLRLLFLCLILGVTSWTGLCRYLRGESLKLREVDYVQAAVALGAHHFSVVFRHILPNVMHIVLITVILDFSGLVLAEAVLSYVQIGVDPTTYSWGNMINSARLEMARDPVVWWSLSAALGFMFTLVLAANFFSDAVRDAFDPRLRSRP